MNNMIKNKEFLDYSINLDRIRAIQLITKINLSKLNIKKLL